MVIPSCTPSVIVVSLFKVDPAKADLSLAEKGILDLGRSDFISLSFFTQGFCGTTKVAYVKRNSPYLTTISAYRRTDLLVITGRSSRKPSLLKRTGGSWSICYRA